MSAADTPPAVKEAQSQPPVRLRLLIAHSRRRGPLSFTMKGQQQKLPTRQDVYLPQFFSREMPSEQAWRDAAEQLASGPNFGGMFAYAHFVRTDMPAGPDARVFLDPLASYFLPLQAAPEAAAEPIPAPPSDPVGGSHEAIPQDPPGEQESAAGAGPEESTVVDDGSETSGTGEDTGALAETSVGGDGDDPDGVNGNAADQSAAGSVGGASEDAAGAAPKPGENEEDKSKPTASPPAKKVAKKVARKKNK